MSDSGKHSQAMAFVNALQNILDSLMTDESKNAEPYELPSEPNQSAKYENTYELFIDTTNKKSLASLIICITLVCAIRHPDPGSES